MIFPGGKEYKRHDSMRGWFAYELYLQMAVNKDIWLVVGDLGYKVFDQHFKDFPERTINTGAAEVAMMDIAVGLALSGKIPFVYSITPFLLYRPFEVLRTYINHEKINVKLVGSGRNDDYKHDGWSHYATDTELILATMNNIIRLWPETKEDVPLQLGMMLKNTRPCFISLRR